MEAILEQNKRYTISVVIPVLNEEKHLSACLKAIKGNSLQPLEILVVDGGSEDRTREIAKKMGAVVLDNPKRNAAAGRNIGIRAAKGEIIAFTDGDCIPDQNWIREIVNAFEQDKIDGLGGYIKPVKSQNYYEKFWGDLSLKELMTYEKANYYVSEKTLNQGFITANCAYTKNLLLQLGGFDEWFGNNAEDIDFAWRAFDAGAILKYVSEVRMRAHSPTELSGIKKKSFRNGCSSSKLQKRYGKLVNYDWRIYKLLWNNIKHYLKCRDRHSHLMIIELCWHLAGKYYGSFKVGVINI